MQMSHIPTYVVRAQDVDVIPTRENSVHTNKDLCCHRELSAWCLIHNPADRREGPRTPLCVTLCHISYICPCQGTLPHSLGSVCFVINQAMSHLYGNNHKDCERMKAIVLVSNSDGKQFQSGCQNCNHFSHFKRV